MSCKCGNAARYINERGELCCGICPLKESLDSIKLADVPKLLAWARALQLRQQGSSIELSASELLTLREIVQRRPELRT